MQPPVDNIPASRQSHVQNLSTAGDSRKNGERAPLLRRRSLNEHDTAREQQVTPSPTLAGGTVLGIHNLAIVAPQFIVRLTSPVALISGPPTCL